MNNDLLLDTGANRICRAELQRIPTPAATRTWKPVSHANAANMVLGEALVRGFNVTSEEYGVNPSGTQMFGVLRFHPEGHPEWSRALGLRNSHDKSIALGLTAGLSVMVCSNLCFGGETTIHRRHTSGIDIGNLIPQAFDALEMQYARLEARVDILKLMRLSENKARALTVIAAEHKIIPSCDILPVFDEFRQPRHEEFAANNMWSLYNSFTEIAKKYSPARADKCYRGLARLFEME